MHVTLGFFGVDGELEHLLASPFIQILNLLLLILHGLHDHLVQPVVEGVFSYVLTRLARVDLIFNALPGVHRGHGLPSVLESVRISHQVLHFLLLQVVCDLRAKSRWNNLLLYLVNTG